MKKDRQTKTVFGKIIFALILIAIASITGYFLHKQIQAFRLQKEIAAEKANRSITKQLTPKKIYSTIPTYRNGLYRGVFNNKLTYVLIANGSLTYANGQYGFGEPRMVTIPEGVRYLGYKVYINDRSITTISTDSTKNDFTKNDFTKMQFIFDGEVLRIIQNGELVGKLTKSDTTTSITPIPRSWNGRYFGTIAGRKITALIYGGSITASLGKIKTDTVVVTFPEQAQYRGYSYTINEDKLTLNLLKYMQRIQLIKSNNSLVFIANNRVFGRLRRK